MQEIVLVLGSVAGACTAIALDKFPARKNYSTTNTANQVSPSNYSSTTIPNQSIQKQISSLEMEKEILNKTIYKLSSQETNISNEQKNALLTRYQEQVANVTSKIESLQYTTPNSQINLIGENLITLMDEKLSSLDKRLAELSSKIANVSQLQQQQEQQKKTSDRIATEKEALEDVQKVKRKDYSKSSSSNTIPSTEQTTPTTSYGKRSEDLLLQDQKQTSIENQEEKVQHVKPAVAAPTAAITTATSEPKEQAIPQNIQQKVRPAQSNIPKGSKRSIELITLTEIPHKKHYPYYQSPTTTTPTADSNVSTTTHDTDKESIAQVPHSTMPTKLDSVDKPKKLEPEKSQDSHNYNSSSPPSVLPSTVPSRTEIEKTHTNEDYESFNKEYSEIHGLNTGAQPQHPQQPQHTYQKTGEGTDKTQQGEEDEEIDINSLKKEIMNTLSKLDQVEVE